jgi:hypothetical protein
MNLSSQQSIKHKIETRHEFIKSAICYLLSIYFNNYCFLFTNTKKSKRLNKYPNSIKIKKIATHTEDYKIHE